MGRRHGDCRLDDRHNYSVLRALVKMPDNKSLDEPENEGRRSFLKFLGVMGIAAVSVGVLRGAVQNIIPTISGAKGGFPTLQLVSSAGSPIKTSDLVVNNPQIVLFNYPLLGDPNFLLRLGDANNKDYQVSASKVTIPATGGTYTSPAGVGPSGSVVAASAICQHLGCKPPELRYHTPSDSSFPGKVHCDCHGSTYDPFTGFSVVTSPTKSPLPSVVLEYDSSSDTYSVNNMVGPTIFGQPTDLTGGSPFPSGTKTTKITTESP